ncbi:MAG TPA: type II toxin-antitoxin system PemK/MazF family toxin [Xanthobacteraceae bacterium]|nr:type II toxin-antitoxin system PemK/MazF family toxin [Xanthobacteraceae bacterium]
MDAAVTEHIQRGEIWWADLPEPRRSEPGFRRPVLVIQADSFNRSRIQTVIVAVITGNLDRAEAPGNVVLPACSSGLPRDSVVNVSQVLTLDRGYLIEHAGTLPARLKAPSMPACAPFCNCSLRWWIE